MDTIAIILGYGFIGILIILFNLLAWNLFVGFLVAVDILNFMLTLAKKDPTHSTFKLLWIPGLTKKLLRDSYQYSNWLPSHVDGTTIHCYSKDHLWYGQWNGYKDWAVSKANIALPTEDRNEEEDV